MNESIIRQNQSESINELATALAKAQAKLTGAKKDGLNPHYKAKFATLESVYEAIREPLAEQGLSVLQPTEFIGEKTFVRTVLLHSSGQWIDGLYPVVVQKPDPQGLGSGMSYSRRYSLMAMIGIPASDDDAEAATGRPAPMPFEKSAPKSAYAKEIPSLRPSSGISEKQVQRLWAIAKKHNVSKDQIKEILNKYGCEKTEQLKKEDYDNICEILLPACAFNPADWERAPEKP